MLVLYYIIIYIYIYIIFKIHIFLEAFYAVEQWAIPPHTFYNISFIIISDTTVIDSSDLFLHSKIQCTFIFGLSFYHHFIIDYYVLIFFHL